MKYLKYFLHYMTTHYSIRSTIRILDTSGSTPDKYKYL